MTKTHFSVIILFMAVAFLPAVAGADDVEVNLDVLEKLEGYTPPPMFGGTVTPQAIETAPEVMTPLPDKDSSQAAVWLTIPKPGKKPPYYNKTSYVQPVAKAAPVETVEQETTYVAPAPSKRPGVFKASEEFVQQARRAHGLAEIEIEEEEVREDLIIHEAEGYDLQIEDTDVRDVLASIDPDAELPPERPKEPEEPKRKRVYAEHITDANGVISIDFLPGESALEEPVSPDVVTKILSHQSRAGRWEVRAYASAKAGGEMAAKRLALQRALNVRDMLTGRKIAKDKIDILPVGRTADSAPIDRVDISFVPAP